MKIKHLLASLLYAVACYAAADAPFTVSLDGQEVTDAKTGLIWRRCPEGMTANGGACTGTQIFITHEAALTRASTQATATGVAWRLPNIKELSSIADKSRSPAYDTVAFPVFSALFFWSSSPNVTDSNFAWNVIFVDGSVVSSSRGAPHSVRLVRAGQ
jgi:Protein of unknown function (DUF1566)